MLIYAIQKCTNILDLAKVVLVFSLALRTLILNRNPGKTISIYNRVHVSKYTCYTHICSLQHILEMKKLALKPADTLFKYKHCFQEYKLVKHDPGSLMWPKSFLMLTTNQLEKRQQLRFLFVYR